MEENHNPASEQEQNYDYIFEALEKQELIQEGKPVLTHPDGRREELTAPKLFKAWMPIFVFLGAMFVLIIASGINKMAAMVIFGMIFMGAAVGFSYAGEGKFRLQPMLFLFFIVGLAISYAATATLVYEAKPFFDMELFKQRSLMGFGIGTAVLGICLIISDILRVVCRRTQVEATCKEIKSRGRVNGRPFGTITWAYDWECSSYTSKTYNTIIGELCEGMTKTLYINPSHPERIRIKGQGNTWDWGVFYLIAGIIVAYITYSSNTFEFNGYLIPILFGMIFMGVAAAVSFDDKRKFRPHPMIFIFFIVGLVISYCGAAAMYLEANPLSDPELFKTYSIVGFGVGTAILGICLIVSDIFHMKNCRTEVFATCKEIKYQGRTNGRPFGTITWQYEWLGSSYTSKTYNTIIGDFCEGWTDYLYINPSHPERIRIKGQGGSWGWGVFYMIVGIAAACSFDTLIAIFS